MSATPAAHNKAPRSSPPRPYKHSPLLAKPGKRSRQDALPTAIHMGLCVSVCLLVFAVINIVVTEKLGPRNPFTSLVNSGVMMAMLTVTVLATPNLGNSFTKAFQRIVGVMIGGWLFYLLYAANQTWWFLVICLAVWAFVLVAASFALSGREFLFPVALVSAFMVVCNFNSVKQAMVMTLVKTIAFSGAIVLYTLVSLLMFPLTATQQLLANLALALRDLEQLADMALVTGCNTSITADSLTTNENSAAKDVEAQTADAAAAAAGFTGPATAATAGKAAKASKKAAATTPTSLAVSLAADANHKLQLVQQLLAMTAKERYMGTVGGYRCFLPTVWNKRGVLPEQEVLAVVVNAGQVLRVLTTVMADFSVPIGKRQPPSTLGPNAAAAVLLLAQQAVAALQDISASLPVSGPHSYPVPDGNLHGFSDKLKQLVALTVGENKDDAGSTSTSTAAVTTPSAVPAANGGGGDGASAAAAGAVGAGGAAGRWQKAAAAAAGVTLPHQRPHHIAEAFSKLLSESVSSEEGQVASWCNVLVLSRQLGRSIAGLNDSLNELLVKLPWTSSSA